MPSTRRQYLRSLGAAAAGSSLLPLFSEKRIAATEAAVRERIAPNMYTTVDEPDRFVLAMEQISRDVAC
ncbi:hypothetical protein JXO52_09495 [bacterium]|nr:hypothetical protein [bacterium]